MKIKEFIRRSTLISLAATQFLFFPVYSTGPVGAQETGGDTTTTSQGETPVVPETPPPPPKAGPRPPGADGSIFVYDYDTDTWESFLYSYDPVARVRTRKAVPTVRYNFETSKWEKIDWSFSAPTKTYFWYVVSTHPTQPSGIVMGATPQYIAQQSQGPSGGSGGSSGGGGTSINGTGAGSNVGVSNTTNNNGDINLNNNADFNIVLDLLSQSGNANVLGNTNGGNAKTGNASSTANILNQIQSQWDISDLLTFSSDIYGDVYGDLLVDTRNIGPNANVNVDNETNNNLDIDVNNDTTIVNDIDVVAQSGNATVAGNTFGGNATSGNANALVNIINMINSSINSGATFMGTLNIHGEFDGDILFPDGALETLISDTGPNSDVSVNDETNNDLDIEINNNTAVANKINANASSGNALVKNNTNGGNATSGNATSNVTMLNLTGKDVVSENTLLVFINVLGQWMGVLMDAPAGTTAAAIGGGSTVATNRVTNNNIDYTENNNASITNNVNVGAHSGDATVKNNTNGGNATTGDANATVNVANLVGSEISSSSWFGVLFINVFGTWNGSFGVDTEAGDHLNNSGNVASASTGGGGQGGEGPESQKTQQTSTSQEPDVRVYSLATNSGSGGGYRAVPVQASSEVTPVEETATTLDDDASSVLSSFTEPEAFSEAASQTKILGVPIGFVAIGLLSAAFLFGNRILLLFTSRRSS